jgi:hypothetical protein
VSDLPRLVTPEELSEILGGVHLQTIQRKVSTKHGPAEWPSVKVAKKLRFTMAQVNEIIEIASRPATTRVVKRSRRRAA